MSGTPFWAAGLASPEFAAAAWRPDVVQLEYHVMGHYLPALAHSPAPRVLHQLEPGTATARDRRRSRRGLSRLAGPLDHRAWERFERAVMGQVQAVVVLTERDAEVLRPLAPKTPIVRIPLGVPIPTRALDPLGSGSPRLLFVRNFVHPPNLQAAERLPGWYLPPSTRRMSGRGIPDRGSPPVEAAARPPQRERDGDGGCPDHNAYREEAAVFVAPLRLGGSMRVKVMEALAVGKAVVASRVAVEGLDVTDGDQPLLAETNPEFARAILGLLRDPERRCALARRAREWAAAHLTWETPVSAFERLYDSLAPNERRGTRTQG